MIRFVAIATLLGAAIPVSAQWLDLPSAGIPQTADGKPNLNAPAPRTPDGKPDLAAACPRTADGKPDFSGLWIMQTSREGNPNFPGCEAVPDEFINIAAGLKEGLPYQSWAADLVKTRRGEQRVHDPLSHCFEKRFRFSCHNFPSANVIPV